MSSAQRQRQQLSAPTTVVAPTTVEKHSRVGLHMPRDDIWIPQADCIFGAKLLHTCDRERAPCLRCDSDRMCRRRLSKTEEIDAEGELRKGCRRETEHSETKSHNPYRRYHIT